MNKPPVGIVAALFTSLTLLAGAGLHAQTPAALVRHAPSVNGQVEGAVQQMLPESVTLNGGAIITGDLFVPGTPTLRLNGNPTFGGTVVGTGAPSPMTHSVTLNGGARLGALRTRSEATVLPTVAAPPPPIGTRSVALNNAIQTAGNFATLRHLTLNGNVGAVAIPPGIYGDFAANGGSGFVLGVAGATTPAVYAFQRLSLNGNSSLSVVGPVIVTLANTLTANSSLGSSVRPDWLTLQFSSGGLTLNGQTAAYAYVLATNGTVTINGQGLLVGGLVSDRLTINGGGTLRLLERAAINPPPTIALTAPANGASFVAPAAFALAATANDTDGAVTRVEFYQGTVKLGEATAPPYQFSVTALAAGSYVFSARAIDSGNAATVSAAITVQVGVNQPPSVVLTTPPNGASFTAPATVTVEAAATDADGTIAKVEFFRAGTKIGEVTSAPFQLSVPELLVGNYTFSVRATDSGNATADSLPVTVTVVSPPNQSPTVALTAPAPGASFTAPATVSLVATASDPDGTVGQVEFFQGSVNLGASLAAPYQYSANTLGAGSYTFKARATDNLGTTADSAPVTIVVVGANLPPTIALDVPLSGTLFNVPATIRLGATASDPDGNIARVEFYQGLTKVGEAAVAPFAYVWNGMLPGSYALSAKAYDHQGATAVSPASVVIVQAALPYVTDFEATEGYATGALHGQGEWVATAGVAIHAADYSGGAWSVTLPASAPAAQASRRFPAYAGQSMVFADVFVKLVAAADTGTAGFVEVEGAKVCLVKNGALGELYAFNGDGTGTGQWRATGQTVALAVNAQTTTWWRLTFREDFTAKKWDLYANRKMIAYDLGFADPTSSLFTEFRVAGSAVAFGAVTLCDALLIGFDHPLFLDADKDGLDDGWEIANSLNPALNDRDGDRDGDGLSNLREYQLGLRANLASTFGDGIPDGLRVSLGLSLIGPTADSTPPSAPANFTASAARLDVALAWGPATDNIGVAGYRISRGDQMIGTTTAANTTWADTVPADGASYTYEVRAVDFAGNFSPPTTATVSVPVVDDDANGLPDAWEFRYFGRTGIDPAADDDGDGLSNFAEFQGGTDPTNFYNGISPRIETLHNGRPGPNDELAMLVRHPDGTPWANAPVTFDITGGYRRISATPGGPVYDDYVRVRADATGLAKVYLEAIQP